MAREWLKVVGRAELPLNLWTHVLVTYDGTSQAAGVKIYINGEPQDTEIAANQLNNTIRTSVPLKVGQRHSSARLDTGRLGIRDVRIHRVVLTSEEVADLAAAGPLAGAMGKPVQERVQAGDRGPASLVAEDPRSRFQELQASLHALQEERGRDPVAGTVAM